MSGVQDSLDLHLELCTYWSWHTWTNVKMQPCTLTPSWLMVSKKIVKYMYVYEIQKTYRNTHTHTPLLPISDCIWRRLLQFLSLSLKLLNSSVSLWQTSVRLFFFFFWLLFHFLYHPPSSYRNYPGFLVSYFWLHFTFYRCLVLNIHDSVSL